MSYQAWSDTVPSQHTNTTTARTLPELVRATETTSSRHTHTGEAAAAAAAEKEEEKKKKKKRGREASKTHNPINTGRAQSTEPHAARYSQNIRWSLWVSGTTCASHPSFLGSSSGRYLKANEARYALHSCSSLPSLSQAAVSQPRG